MSFVKIVAVKAIFHFWAWTTFRL